MKCESGKGSGNASPIHVQEKSFEGKSPKVLKAERGFRGHKGKKIIPARG
jgi:hypothetical protein